MTNLGNRRGNLVAARDRRFVQAELDAAQQLARPGAPPPRALSEDVFQLAHGFVAKDPVYHNGTSWVKADAADLAGAKAAIGVIESAGTNVFTIVYSGRIRGLSGLTPGALYYVATGGGITTTAPAGAQPILVALSATEGVVVPWGVSSGGTLTRVNGSFTDPTSSLTLGGVATGGRPFIVTVQGRTYSTITSGHRNRISATCVVGYSAGAFTYRWNAFNGLIASVGAFALVDTDSTISDSIWTLTLDMVGAASLAAVSSVRLTYSKGGAEPDKWTFAVSVDSWP